MKPQACVMFIEDASYVLQLKARHGAPMVYSHIEIHWHMLHALSSKINSGGKYSRILVNVVCGGFHVGPFTSGAGYYKNGSFHNELLVSAPISLGNAERPC
jgi:hypothetical protein